MQSWQFIRFWPSRISLRAVLEGLEDHGVVVEIAGLDELDGRVAPGGLVGVAVDALDQHPGEQEVGEDDDAPEAEAGDPVEGALGEREGDARIADLGPGKAHALPQHSRDLGHIGVGVGVRGAAPDHHQAGVVAPDVIPGLGLRRLDAVAGGAQQLEIDGELAPVIDAQALVLGGVAVEHRGNVVLGVGRGEQHAGQGQDAGRAGQAQLIEARADDRRGEFEEAVGRRVVGQPPGEPGGEVLELADRIDIAAAVAADHDRRLIHGWKLLD